VTRKTVAEQIKKFSEAFELVPGDVIDCHIDGLPNLSIKIV